jgi:hypothetical protein
MHCKLLAKLIILKDYMLSSSMAGNCTPSSLHNHEVIHSPTVIFMPTSSWMSMLAKLNCFFSFVSSSSSMLFMSLLALIWFNNTQLRYFRLKLKHPEVDQANSIAVFWQKGEVEVIKKLVSKNTLNEKQGYPS